MGWLTLALKAAGFLVWEGALETEARCRVSNRKGLECLLSMQESSV